jgi:hypothetical protein
MKSPCSNTFRYILTDLALSSALILIFATPLFAQVTRGVPRESEAERNERILAEREWLLRSIGKAKKKDVQVEPQRLTLAQVKEDYEGIQVANNSILKMMYTSRELDRKLIANSTLEIKKHASRLKAFLTSLELVGEDKRRRRELPELDLVYLKSSLLVLDASIVRMVGNPIFKNIDKVVDVESSRKARDELENIIEFSERIRRSVERSMKNASASR